MKIPIAIDYRCCFRRSVMMHFYNHIQEASLFRRGVIDHAPESRSTGKQAMIDHASTDFVKILNRTQE